VTHAQPLKKKKNPGTRAEGFRVWISSLGATVIHGVAGRGASPFLSLGDCPEGWAVGRSHNSRPSKQTRQSCCGDLGWASLFAFPLRASPLPRPRRRQPNPFTPLEPIGTSLTGSPVLFYISAKDESAVRRSRPGSNSNASIVNSNWGKSARLKYYQNVHTKLPDTNRLQLRRQRNLARAGLAGLPRSRAPGGLWPLGSLARGVILLLASLAAGLQHRLR